MGPSYVPPHIEIPTNWKNQPQLDNSPSESEKEFECKLEHWWDIFKDPKLDELEILAMGKNRNLFIALERIQEARALMGVAASNFYPKITLNPLFSDTNQLAKRYGNGKDLTTIGLDQAQVSNLTQNTLFREHVMLYFLPINLSYEVDLWGKIRDGYNSASYDWWAQQKDFETIMLSLTSSLAITYYQLRIADSQIDLLRKIIESRQKAFNINQDRYENEISNFADVTLAAQELDSAIVEQLEVYRQREVLENQLAILIGVPASEFHIEHTPLDGAPPSIPAGLPSELLIRRPDIAEAEYNARSEQALVKQSYSQLFPSLILTAAAGYESPVLKYFLKSISRFWMNSTEVDQIFFDGGASISKLNAQMARFQQASGAYQQTVLKAFQEVENALISVSSYENQHALAQETVTWAKNTYQLYLDRYIDGIIYYIDVTNTERNLLNYEINAIEIQGSRFIATIELIKALGGSW